jgi:hypothetical protein
MKIGYVIASKRVMRDGEPVRYLYRERPDRVDDSGWRIFSDPQENADDPLDFAMYNASTLVIQEPALASLLGMSYPVAFEWDPQLAAFVEVPAPILDN